MRKAILLHIVLLFSLVKVNAQLSAKYFYLRGGLSLFAAREKERDGVLFPGVTICPGIRTLQNENFAFTISAPVTIGGTFKNQTSLGVDLPLMADLNFGSAAGNNGTIKAGGIMGGGLGYFNVVNDIGDQSSHTEFWGYRFHAGVSFSGDATGSSALILASFGESLSSTKAWVAGLSIQFILGNK